MKIVGALLVLTVLIVLFLEADCDNNGTQIPEEDQNQKADVFNARAAITTEDPKKQCKPGYTFISDKCRKPVD
ncbi:unnamed protein product [Diamesa serratosioi]